MGRIRTIKPSFFRSRSLAKVTVAARLTFQGLWCEADDAGIGVADSRILKGAIWPLDDDITHETVENHLKQLAETGHINVYETDSDRYYQIVAWAAHQAPAFRRGSAKYPQPVDNPGTGPETGQKDPLTSQNTNLHFSASQEVQKSAGLDGIKDGIGGLKIRSGSRDAGEGDETSNTMLREQETPNPKPTYDPAVTSSPETIAALRNQTRHLRGEPAA